MITTDTILEQLKKWVEDKHPISPDLWLDACAKLNVLKSDENDKLFDLQQEVALIKQDFIVNGKTVSYAKVMVEAGPTFKEMQKQKAKIEMIEEQIRISKIQARMSFDGYKNS